MKAQLQLGCDSQRIEGPFDLTLNCEHSHTLCKREKQYLNIKVMVKLTLNFNSSDVSVAEADENGLHICQVDISVEFRQKL